MNNIQEDSLRKVYQTHCIFINFHCFIAKNGVEYYVTEKNQY
jgi:hypothetical protein